jgi:hypothetical protein
MDSPILPILIGGGVLAAVVLGSRRASAQDRDAGGAGGAIDTGGLNFDLPVIDGAGDEPGRPALEPGQGRLLITVDPRIEPGTLYVVDKDGWGGRYGSTTVRSWSYREGGGMVLDLAVDPGNYEAFVRSPRLIAGQRNRKVTITGRALIRTGGNIAIYLHPNEYNDRRVSGTAFTTEGLTTGGLALLRR